MIVNIMMYTHGTPISFKNFQGAPWYNMPPTIHKVLEHGKDLIDHCPLPIGLTSEEASEANNKNLRKIRFHHARNSSMKNTMTDIFHRLTDTSDPIIVNFSTASRPASARARKPLSDEIKALLESPELPIDNIFETEDDILI
jgi:hypothetical protein